jgi:signal transduction histidine kinase/ligand-binding sensor domain-containing protein/DNA-binding response OmpR family regulator
MYRISALFIILILATQAISQSDGKTYTTINLSTEHGLIHPRINALAQDQNGFLWIGTHMGLNRFDGQQFRAFHHNPLDEQSLSEDYIRSLFIDSKNNLWIGTDNGGVNLFRPEDESFKLFKIKIGSNSRLAIKNILEDATGNIWIACVQGLIKLDPSTEKMTSYPNPVFAETSGSLETLYIDGLGRFWVGFWEGGLFLFDPSTGNYEPFLDDPAFTKLKNASPMSIKEDSKRNLWIGTYTMGLVKISYPGHAITIFAHDKNNINSVNSNKIKSIEISDDDRIWIGTEEAGLDLYDPVQNTFTHFFSGFQSERSIEGKSFYVVMKDNSNRLWLGSRENGLFYFNTFDNPFCHINRIKGAEPQSDLVITALCEDPSGNVWAGKAGDIALVDFEKKFLTPQNLNIPETPNAIGSDALGNIWIGGLRGGIYCYNPTLKTLQSYIFKELENIKITTFFFRDDYVFIGSDAMLAMLNVSTQQFQFINNPHTNGVFLIIAEDSLHYYFRRRIISVFDRAPASDPFYRPMMEVEYLFPNSKCGTSTDQHLYCGTDWGLFSIDKKSFSVSFLEKLPGPISYSVKSVHPENNNTIWFSTEGSIVRYVPSTGYLRVFDQFDGIPGIAYRDGVSCRTADGRIIMGGENGLVAFYPQRIKPIDKIPGIEISSITPGRNNNPENRIHTRSLSENNKKLELSYIQNFFTIDWTMPEYIQPRKVLYTWQLEGFDKDWNSAYNQHFATYMNLPAGNYTFHVRGRDTENNWSQTQTLNIIIAPPLWLTWYAYLLYFVLVAFLLYQYRKYNIKKVRLHHELKMQRLKLKNIQQLAKKEHEVNEWKFRFFTNISHEFKTPLMLIISPLEQFIENGRSLSDTSIHQIHNNAQRLFKLISQMLDFRKMEAGKLTLHTTYENIVPFATKICSYFREPATRKKLALEIIAHEKSIYTHFDTDKMEKILYNLMSNALKYTTAGKIKVEISRKIKKPGTPQQSEWVEIAVTDTGQGIPAEDISQVFERFYQVKAENRRNEGTGIGLSLSKELVKLHKGKINVTSVLGKGSTFTMHIPIVAEEITDENLAGKINIDELTHEKDPPIQPGRPLVLIADDNDEMRNYLVRELESDFDIIKAKDGASALVECKKHHPDVILSDILMPGTDGLEFCRQLKSNQKISHIPIILTTALSSPEYREEAFNCGADEFITKPFKITFLKEMINNFLAARTARNQLVIQNLGQDTLMPNLASNDEIFLNKAHQLILNNMADKNFSIELLAKEMSLTRSQLYRKIKALTGLTASEYIRMTRMRIESSKVQG